jgi:YihY family inner membrane protein
LVLLFFSTQAFATLERAMAVIFRQRRERVGRHFLTSLVIPYLYLGALGVGLLIISGLTTLIRAARHLNFHILEWTLSLGPGSELALWLLRLVSEVVLLSSLYVVLPGGRVRLKHALLGGMVATVLWECTRRLLVWYYQNLSMVGVIYGSLATTIVALLTMDAAAVIILFSAQVIAEYEQKKA